MIIVGLIGSHVIGLLLENKREEGKEACKLLYKKGEGG